MEANIFEMRDVSKSFGEVQSLHDVNFHVGPERNRRAAGRQRRRQIDPDQDHHGLPPTHNRRALFQRQKVTNLTVPKARALGVETVYQERALADLQTLWRNIFLGRELSNRFGFHENQEDAAKKPTG